MEIRTARGHASKFNLYRHWLINGSSDPDKAGRDLCYSAGVMVLTKDHPRIIHYRTPEPVLTPSSPEELEGTISNAVFPTGIDRRDDLGDFRRFDIYYGMADNRIGVARLDLPGVLPARFLPLREVPG